MKSARRGIEAVAGSNPGFIPTSKIASPLLFGFTFMFIVERLISPHAHSHSHHSDLVLHSVKGELRQEPFEVKFDAELSGLKREEALAVVSTGRLHIHRHH